MSLFDRLSVRFTAFVLAIALVCVATHYVNAGIDAKGHNTLDQREASDKGIFGN
jgi:preprotein translocase subunit SecF